MSGYTQNSIKARNQDFERFLDSVMFETIETELTPEKKRERRAKADRSDLDFCKIYYPQIFDSPFNDLHRHIAGLKQGNYSVSGSPMFGKTAFTVCAKLIKPIAMNLTGVYNISMRIQELALERSAMVKRLITANPTLMYDYDIEMIQDKKGYYIFGGCVLIATSYEKGLRSYLDDNFKRFRFSLMDDLFHRNSVKSMKDNERVYDFVTGEVWRQMEDDGLSIFLGNSITHDCPIVRHKQEFPENHFSMPCIDENGHSNWPERFDDEYWQNKETEIPVHVWQGEYLDNPYEMGENFTEDMIHYININTLNILAVISVIDPAHGESPASCFKAVMTGGWTDKDKMVNLDMFIRKTGYENVFDYVDRLRQAYKKWKAFLFENDFNQWSMARPYYENWRKRTGKTLPIIPHLSKNLATDYYGSDKDSRILNLIYPHMVKDILYADSLKGDKDHLKYIQQLVAHGAKKEKLDGPDAEATLWIMSQRYVTTGTFKPSKKRKMKKDKFSLRGFFK